MDSLRTPFFVAALVLLVLALGVEVGSAWLVEAQAAPGAIKGLKQPGIGISYLALYDSILLYSVAWMGLSLILPARVLGRVQGIVSLIFFLLLLLGTVILIFVALAFLIMLISLLVAIPFGTAFYMVTYGDFDTGAAKATLTVIMLLKIGFGVCLILAQQRFLTMKALLVLIFCSLLLTLLVSFLHALAPGFLVSIVDAVGAIVIGVVAAIWALISLLGSLPAIVKALRVDRALA